MFRDSVKIGIAGGILTGLIYAAGRLDGRIEMSVLIKGAIEKVTGEK